MRSKLGLWVLGMLVAANVAAAGPRDRTLAALESVMATAKSDAVQVRVNGGSGNVLRIGDALVFSFESTKAGYLTAIHIDPHGGATLLYPRQDVEAGRLEARSALNFPSAADAFTVEVEAPIGRDVVYAFVTDDPIARQDLGISDEQPVVVFEPRQAADFAPRLRSVLASIPKAQLQANKISQQTNGRGDVKYRSADIIDFFGARTRAIEPPRLDLQIRFETDSAKLDAAARRNIDEFAAALADSRLRQMRFAVGGHTDDRGTEAHNDSLSRERARSVQSYLIERAGIDPARLEIEAYGESQPLLSEKSEYAREMNRRVEFTPIR